MRWLKARIFNFLDFSNDLNPGDVFRSQQLECRLSLVFWTLVEEAFCHSSALKLYLVLELIDCFQPQVVALKAAVGVEFVKPASFGHEGVFADW